MDFSGLLSRLEGVVDPSILKTIESSLVEEVSKAEDAFKSAAEEKYGIAPQVISDAVHVVEDAAPVAAKVEDALPADIKTYISDLVSQLTALQTQVNALKSQNAANQTSSVMGQGEPVPHTLFLEDGSVVKNHAGVATEYSSVDSLGNDVIRKVVAAYPTA